MRRIDLEYADLIPVLNFVQCCEANFFTDYDGFGYWANLEDPNQPKEDETIRVSPRQVVLKQQIAPKWATHVNWINR